MVEVPCDSKILMEQYWAQQKEAEAKRAMDKKEGNPKRQAREEARLRKPMRPLELEQIAKKRDVPILNGGNHRQLVNPSSGEKCAYTRHPGTMSPPVQKSAVRLLLSC